MLNDAFVDRSNDARGTSSQACRKKYILIVPAGSDPGWRQLHTGAYFTMEYSVGSAALFN
jgi:hypothetical protein